MQSSSALSRQDILKTAFEKLVLPYHVKHQFCISDIEI